MTDFLLFPSCAIEFLYSCLLQFTDETRERVLLAHKSEIHKLLAKKQQDGITLVPTAITYRNGKIKVIVGICKGKNNYDKRHALKEKQTKRDMARSMKQY